MNFCTPPRSDSRSSINSSSRPLPLKQRTSSKDTRRDYTHNTWTSLLVLLNIREFFITVDNFTIWRRHLAWAMESGKDLKTYMTQRYASNMVFMSLLLSTELGVLFNSAAVTTNVRNQLRDGQHWSFSFWAGLILLISSLLTILSLISTFTAWAMVNSVNPNNAHCIFRSSIGQYAAELPGRLIVCSIYSFLVSFVIYFFLLLPVGIWSILLLVSTVFLFVHIVSVFSALGRVIMHSGAMGDERIFAPDFEEQLLPQTLHSSLLAKSKANLENSTSIVRQYRRKQTPINRFLSKEELYKHLCGQLEAPQAKDFPNANRARVDSTVRFADEELGRRSKAFDRQPLSDISSPDASPNGFAGASKSPGQAPTVRPSSLHRPKYSTPPPLPPPNVPKPNNFDPQALRNVSSSSLEQWLQASPRGSIEGTPGGSFSEAEHLATIGDQSPPSPPFRQSTPESLISRPQTSSERMSSIRSSVSSTKSFREMTDDERFVLDYGDFGDFHDSNGDIGGNKGGEKASLLQNSQPYHDYGNSG